jgi:hypothetical protein
VSIRWLRRHPEPWELFPAKPGDQGFLKQAQRDFILKALDENTSATNRERKRMRSAINRCIASGHQSLADSMIFMSLNLARHNRIRIIEDEAYWQDFQRIVLGRRMDKREYLFPEAPGKP